MGVDLGHFREALGKISPVNVTVTLVCQQLTVVEEYVLNINDNPGGKNMDLV